MKKKISVIFIIAIFVSCRSIRLVQDMSGQYSKQGKDYFYNLVLNRDSSFVLTQRYFEVNSTCQGRWQCLSKDTLLLKCNPEDLSAQLQGGYMSEREKRVLVLSKKKLRLGKTTLKRK